MTPFTERRLLELCVNLPDRQRLRDGWTKPVLRNAMAGRMPESVRLRCDKQHLGWRLSGILWNRHENLAQRWPSIARTLSPYLAPGPLPPETPVAGHRWSRHLLHVIALERWIVRARED